MQNATFKVTGMTCDGCTSKVTHALKEIAGVGNVVVSLATGQADVGYDEHLTSPDQLKSAVNDAGYCVDGAKEADDHQAHDHKSPGKQSKGCCCC